MAKYDVSQNGVDNLNKLSSDLGKLNGDIEDCGKKLITTVSGLGNQLGIYENKIIDLVTEVNHAQVKGRESVEQLATAVSKLAKEVEVLVKNGLGK